MGLSFLGDEFTMSERKEFWEMGVKKRLKRLRWMKGALEGLLAAWATYNMTRYLFI